MKSSIVLFVIAFILVTVQAAILRGTNADRMARGLPPRAPAKLYTPTRVSEEKRHKPSSTPTGVCKPNEGRQVCCERVTTASDPEAKLLLELLHLELPPEAVVGLICSDATPFGPPCIFKTACCEETNHNGLVDTGCIVREYHFARRCVGSVPHIVDTTAK
ncbi:hypothetical protein C8Q73DRAFT_659294 [Cubamyces lactineus]|nr:hypothetical protein C8Q73DRAFT_659294 [Cubamyces lactineus]